MYTYTHTNICCHTKICGQTTHVTRPNILIHTYDMTKLVRLYHTCGKSCHVAQMKDVGHRRPSTPNCGLLQPVAVYCTCCIMLKCDCHI